MEAQTNRLNDAELHELFDRMFPAGFAGQDVFHDIAPDGWEQSPLILCFHPTPEQLHEEAVRLHRALERLRLARRGNERGQPETARLRTELEEMNARARQEAIDRPPPSTVAAYRQVYGHDPRGWPTA